jgi:hypothetical protein
MRRRGIAMQLLMESIRRFGTSLEGQDYTEAGLALANRARELLRMDPDLLAAQALARAQAVHNSGFM